MALNLKTISRTGLGKMVIHTDNPNRTTITIWCSRFESKQIIRTLPNNTGYIKDIYFNGKRIILN